MRSFVVQPVCAALMKWLCSTATLHWAHLYNQLVFYSRLLHLNAAMNLGVQGLERLFLVQEAQAGLWKVREVCDDLCSLTSRKERSGAQDASGQGGDGSSCSAEASKLESVESSTFSCSAPLGAAWKSGSRALTTSNLAKGSHLSSFLSPRLDVTSHLQQLILKFSTWGTFFFIAVEFAKAALRLTQMDYGSCVNISVCQQKNLLLPLKPPRYLLSPEEPGGNRKQLGYQSQQPG